MPVFMKRVYDPASPKDGQRILVDRLWPRGLTKERAAVDEWLRDLAPSDELRRWYHVRPGEWARFRQRYLKELSHPDAQRELEHLYSLASRRKRLTLLFGSKNLEQNNALVLKELLEGARKPPTGTGPAAAHAMRPRHAAIRRR
jgi:uncharacterized protein YeaO (DUF488 family)